MVDSLVRKTACGPFDFAQGKLRPPPHELVEPNPLLLI